MKAKQWLAAVSMGVAMVAAASSAPIAADMTVKQLMHQRHENFHALEDHYEGVLKEVGKSGVDWQRVKADSEKLLTLSSEILQWFPPGTGPEVGKTKAKAEVWSRPDEFKSQLDRYAQEVRKLSEAVDGRDQAAAATRIDAVGKACGACHDTFRKQSGLFSIFKG